MIPADLSAWEQRFNDLRSIAAALNEALLEVRWEALDVAREFIAALPEALSSDECNDLLSLAGYDAVLSEIDGAEPLE